MARSHRRCYHPGVVSADALSTGLVEHMQLLAEPHYRDRYYHGDNDTLRVQRHFSYSDRIRYYWPFAAVSRAVEGMFLAFGDEPTPETLLSQHLPQLYPWVVSGQGNGSARELVPAAIGQVLAQYGEACGR